MSNNSFTINSIALNGVEYSVDVDITYDGVEIDQIDIVAFEHKENGDVVLVEDSHVQSQLMQIIYNDHELNNPDLHDSDGITSLECDNDFDDDCNCDDCINNDYE